MQIALYQFEQIDSQMGAILLMGSFEACADPRGYIRASNRLFDLCVEATSFDYVNDYADAIECAARIVTLGLLGQIEILDEEAA